MSKHEEFRTENDEFDTKNDEFCSPGMLVWSGLGGALGYPAAKKCDPSNSALKQKGWALKPLANASEVAMTAPGGGCLTQQGGGYQGG